MLPFLNPKLPTTNVERLVAVLDHAREMVARAVSHLDVDATSTRMSEDVWRITCGSATGSVRLLPAADDEGQTVVMVTMSVLHVPPQHTLAVYRKLLELNYEVHAQASFALTEDYKVVLIASRHLQELDEPGLIELIHEASTLADHYDDHLADYFRSPR